MSAVPADAVPAPAAETPVENSAPVRLPLGFWVASFAWPLLVASAVLWWHARGENARLAAELAARPPVAVIDTLALTERLGTGDSPEARAVDGLRQTRALANRLREDGYVVIDRRFLEAYPKDVEVAP